jgi:hypothetical protein
MKKLTFIIIALFAGSFLMVLSSFVKKYPEGKKKISSTYDISGEKDPVIIKTPIPRPDAYKLVQNYKRRHVLRRGLGGGFERIQNTRSVWYSIDQMEEIVKRIKKEGGDGIRFYFARYDEEIVGNICHSKQNTILMVSTNDTLIEGKLLHFDYYEDKKGLVVKIVPENKGEICPPPKDCKTIGAFLDEKE